ncbi:hypothetical protein HELRODRAFT_183695 [Helobdella robusta]|uniref:Uncharacterized protein n=1 Tax=Helobdella robusta TaxID=6412 RepID=T1FK22_HELRO|nr:hypothetical protein HELRODRAFT_183695 [Helobdella robusta]ESO10372.1 hypothetical protein HELRODRAFT_183695 [Helobdella robusta]
MEGQSAEIVRERDIFNEIVNVILPKCWNCGERNIYDEIVIAGIVEKKDIYCEVVNNALETITVVIVQQHGVTADCFKQGGVILQDIEWFHSRIRVWMCYLMFRFSRKSTSFASTEVAIALVIPRQPQYNATPDPHLEQNFLTDLQFGHWVTANANESGYYHYSNVKRIMYE